MGQKRISMKYFELSKNETTTYQNLQNEVKVVHRGIFIALNAYIRKGEISEFNHLSFQIQETRKRSANKIQSNKGK